MEELIKSLKQQIIDALNLDDIVNSEIDIDAPLFGDHGLGLDSIDALEIIVILEKYYGIKIQSPAESKEIFTSIRSIAQYINENRTK